MKGEFYESEIRRIKKDFSEVCWWERNTIVVSNGTGDGVTIVAVEDESRRYYNVLQIDGGPLCFSTLDEAIEEAKKEQQIIAKNKCNSNLVFELVKNGLTASGFRFVCFALGLGLAVYGPRKEKDCLLKFYPSEGCASLRCDSGKVAKFDKMNSETVEGILRTIEEHLPNEHS